MANEPKEAYLNHSYFGPTIPPQQTPHNRPIRSPFRNCSPYSLLCTIFKIITAIIIVIGIIVLILWLVYQPTKLKVYVENANLTQFNLTSSNTLAYTLSAQLSIRNTNKRVGITYKRINAIILYDNTKLGEDGIPAFYQQKKNTTLVDTKFAGTTPVIDESDKVTYTREKGEGWFYVNMKVYTKVRLRMIVVNSVAYEPEIDCSLRLPDPMNATSVRAGFTRTQCDVDEFS